MKKSLLAIIGLVVLLFSCSKKDDPSKNVIDKTLIVGKWKHSYDILKIGRRTPDTLHWNNIDDYIEFHEGTGTSHMSGALIMVYPPVYHTQSFNYSISGDTLALKYSFGIGHFQIKQLNKKTLVIHCNTTVPIYVFYPGSPDNPDFYNPSFENVDGYSNDAYFSRY